MGTIFPEREVVRPLALYFRFRGGRRCEWSGEHRADDPGEAVQTPQLPVRAHRQLHGHRSRPIRPPGQLLRSQGKPSQMDCYRKFPDGNWILYFYHTTRRIRPLRVYL